jgi:hypothetical protein
MEHWTNDARTSQQMAHLLWLQNDDDNDDEFPLVEIATMLNLTDITSKIYSVSLFINVNI